MRLPFCVAVLTAVGAGCGQSTIRVQPGGDAGGCEGGRKSCGGQCANTLSNPLHCGDCGKECGATEFCSQGSCATACPAGTSPCGQSCLSLDSDPLNCGVCYRACAAREKCEGGNCVSACAPGLTDCGSSCVDLNQTSTCGTSCDGKVNCSALPNVAAASCSSGRCSITACAAGFDNCNGDVSDGCEANLNLTSSCGTACGNRVDCSALPNVAAASCSSGACSITACAAGFNNCNSNVGDGCETNFNSPSSCGTSCGALVNCTALPNVASAACSAGACTITACAAGFGNCDSSVGTGCERDLNQPTSCGTSCGSRVNCTTRPHVASATCSSGTCRVVACDSGHGDCDSVGSNGCEEDLRANESRCGSCTVSCNGGQTCRASACTASWQPLPGVALSGRAWPTAVWTGSKMLVWGGNSGSSCPNAFGDGAAFDGASWAILPASPCEARSLHTAVWTGSRMIIWGGAATNSCNWVLPATQGCSYDPVSSSWAVLPGSPISGRAGHSAVWTGSEMIVWGGRDLTQCFADGAAYNPSTGAWRAIPAQAGLSARWMHAGVWALGRMVIWGGQDINGTHTNTGGIFDANLTYLGATPTAGAPSARVDFKGVFADSVGRMLVWGGYAGSPIGTNTGAVLNAYNSTSWDRSFSTVGAPVGVKNTAAVWTGTELIVWGGRIRDNIVGGVTTSTDLSNGGGRYNYYQDLWTSVTTVGAPVARETHTAVWTGSEVWLWGGSCTTQWSPEQLCFRNDGYRYLPP